MSKYVDIKVTVWQRLYFDEETNMQDIIKVIKDEGPINVANEEIGFIKMETLDETEDVMTVEENEDNPTVEVYDEDELIWDNSPKVS